MKLIENGEVIEPDKQTLQILSLEDFLANPELSPELSSGIRIGVDSDLDELRPHLDKLALIVIEFLSFADGRGFSTAHRLRHSLGYAGKIWASGSLIADQYALGVQCGIDAILVDEQLLQRQPIEHWRLALATAPLPYRFHGDMLQDHKLPRLRLSSDSEIIDGLNARFKGQATEQLLEFILNNECFGKSALVSSFGAESAVLLHMVAKISPNFPVLFLDTDKLFPETLEYRSELAARLKFTNVKTLRPDNDAIERGDRDGTLWQSDDEACCNLRKVAPLQNALAEYDTWISGRKSYQSKLRAPLQLFERSGRHIKINPMVNWTRDQLAGYMQQHELPAHPLVAQGYASIGCVPCTMPVCDGEHARAGRWRGLNKTECGIHSVNGKTVRDHQQSI